MCFLLLALAVGASAFHLQEGFDYSDGTDTAKGWFTESVSWEVKGQALVCEGGPRSFAILEQAPHGKEVSVEATVTVRERVGEDWGICGVCIRQDASNYWHLAFIEAPVSEGGKHYVELTEMLDGSWLAESAEGTRLTAPAQHGKDFDWEYGRPYRLRIVMKPEGIEGFVFDTTGAQHAHLSYVFDNTAVTTGQPALDCADFLASFDDVAVAVRQQAPSPEDGVTCPPYAADGYESITAGATGFFYPKEIEGRWWLIDPNGQGFYMVGTDHASYRVHWCQKLGYAPYSRNVQAKYGSEEKWAETTAQRLADWGFNTLPANHSIHLRHGRFPYIEFLSMGSSFAAIDDVCPKTTWTGFPNVFSAKWAAHCDKMAKQRCAPVKDDPWLIGYFLDNELEWFGKNHKPWGLFDEAWKKRPRHSVKRAWVSFLRKELLEPSEFVKHWAVVVADWNALARHTAPALPLTDKARAMAERWTRLIAERYFKTCADAIRRHDPNHLILGCRFAGTAPEIWDIAGRYCDIVSFNMYPRIDVERGVPKSVAETIREWQREAGKPMMITEWSFPALDSGLPCVHGAGMRVDTQTQRARCFTHFQKLMFSLPFMVGSNYFMYVDEPALGISDTFPEDTNYGLVNEQDEPYPELTGAATTLNAQVYALHEAADPQTFQPAARLVPWLSEQPDRELPVPDAPLALDAGTLNLEGPVDDHAWRLKHGDTLLGHFHAMMHQVTSQSLWVPSDHARITALRENDRVIAVEMELSRGRPGEVITRVEQKTGRPDKQEEQPRRYRSGWRFWIPKDGGAWMASQCLWVENADDTPWTLEDVFHYVFPAVGGASAGDEPLLSGVPNYYRRGAAWVDKEAQAGIGCWYADEDAFACNFWRDPGGGFHSDMRENVGVALDPGQRRPLPGRLAFFFPLADISPAGFGRATGGLASAVVQAR